jgi:hypothetical protein
MSTTPLRSYGAIVQDDSDGDSDSTVGASVHGTDYNQSSPRSEPSHDRARRRSFIEEDEEELQLGVPTREERKVTVTWGSLPHKRQLAILTVARFSEPLVQSSLRVSSAQQLEWSA